MNSWFESYKPRASRRLQLLLAGAMWSAVGTVLLFFGIRWCFEGVSFPTTRQPCRFACTAGSRTRVPISNNGAHFREQ